MSDTLTEPRQWDIRSNENRAALAARSDCPGTESEFDEYVHRVGALRLPDYWFLLGPLGHISIPVAPRRSQGIDFATALAGVRSLWLLRDRPGFDHLIEGWRNAPQIDSAFSELRCIQYLSSASSHIGMSFGPLVTGDKNGSRSDVLWETTRGEFLVEVKSLRVLESDVGARAYRMLGEAIEALGGYQTELVGRRLDVVCSASGANFPKLLSAAVAEIGELNKAHVGATGEQDFVKATLRERAEDAEAGGPCIRACAASVGTTPTKISPLAGSECWLTVSFLFGPKLHRAVRAIVGRARRQLRDSARPAIIYLEAAHLPTVVEYLREVMLQGAFAAIPLVIVSDGETLHLVRRQVMDPVDESLDATLAVLAIGENAA